MEPLRSVLRLIRVHDAREALSDRWSHIVVTNHPGDEVRAWLTENVRGPYEGIQGVFGFASETDAAAFKVRFG